MNNVKHYIRMMPITQQKNARLVNPKVLKIKCGSMREAIGILSTAKTNIKWFEFWMDYAHEVNRNHTKN